MLDQLMQLIQQSGQQAVVENNEVPNENNEAIMNEAQQSITSGLQQLAATGQLNTLMESVQNGQAATDHPAVQNISNNFMGSIMDKFGLNKGTAAMIASAIIPMVLSKVMNKGGNAQPGGGGFDLGGLLSSLTGGGSNTGGQAQQGGGGIMDTISNIGAKFGLDKDGDGDVDLNDLGKLIS
ncbi:hypothetical protein [Taibaiella chishuiensis]|uniref:EF-hand domain-containing protein n=1 Tax=Taibaiella chishuiensis TaxID=1434707 RepID=A0A2P8CYM9_9BACT|nr:hypothetical protein [Taibaiella chishuiensis]PSK90079.1 hypothetical protein B0I18_10985 [Taibaiella chishuiensis]